MTDKTPSEFVRHIACPACGSSDANALYTDGHTYCHSCHAYAKGEGEAPESSSPRRMSNPNLIQDLTFTSLTARGISEETCRTFGYGIADFNGQKVQVANYRTPDGTAVVAQKVRFKNKDFVMLGDAKAAGLYGQHLWRDGGKYVVVTEGEIDALSVAEVELRKWPVVSIPSGAAGARKAVQKQLEWLERFENVILMFDMDEPGRKAAAECADLFTPGKAKIASLPLKDANDMLKAGRGGEIVKAKFDAKSHRPDGIVAGTELWDKIIHEEPNDAVPWPFSRLQEMTRGLRKGEVITFTSGSGMGKTEVVRQVYYNLLMTLNERLGLLHLEEPTKRTALGLMGLYLNKRIHIDRSLATEAELREAYDKTVGNGNVFLYDHFGSTESENLFAKIRYLAKGCGCSTIVLDHISIVVSGIEDGDERRIIDNLMTKLATMAQELNVRIVIISHLKKPDGTPHEEGGRVSLDQLRGSGSIKQLSHTVIGLERNQQDEARKHLTRIRVLKCRFTGETGEADLLKYDTDTGKLHETNEVFEEAPTPSDEDDGNKDF